MNKRSKQQHVKRQQHRLTPSERDLTRLGAELAISRIVGLKYEQETIADERRHEDRRRLLVDAQAYVAQSPAAAAARLAERISRETGTEYPAFAWEKDEGGWITSWRGMTAQVHDPDEVAEPGGFTIAIFASTDFGTEEYYNSMVFESDSHSIYAKDFAGGRHLAELVMRLLACSV